MSIFTINHNIASINTQRNINNTSLGLSKSLEKLSSGLRINTGWDGPADLVISEQLRSEIGGIKAAVRNTQESMNFLAIGEGALNEISKLMTDLRARAIHASNTDIISADQIEADQAEVDNALDSINRIANSTMYAGKLIFDDAAAKVFHIGPGASAATNQVSFTTWLPSMVNLSLDGVVGGGTYALSADPAGAMSFINAAIIKVASLRGAFGSFMKGQLQANIDSLGVTLENVTATESYIRDTNMAEEISEYTKQQILVQAGMSVLAQSNVSSQSVLALLR